MGFMYFRYGLVWADGDESASAVGGGGGEGEKRGLGLQGAATLPKKANRLITVYGRVGKDEA